MDLGPIDTFGCDAVDRHDLTHMSLVVSQHEFGQFGSRIGCFGGGPVEQQILGRGIGDMPVAGTRIVDMCPQLDFQILATQVAWNGPVDGSGEMILVVGVTVQVISHPVVISGECRP